jgi:hypothetical protein
MYKKILSIIPISFFMIMISMNLSDSYSQTSMCVGTENDRDGDGLLNTWETQGIDINNDTLADYGLSRFNVSPNHKDLFLEIDYMTNHRAYAGVIQDVVDAFAQAPVCNPDGQPGINLHIQEDQQIPHQSVISIKNNSWKEFDLIKKEYFGTLEEKIDNPEVNNTLLAKSKIFHYAIFGHAINSKENSVSGISRGMPGMDFVVTLGNWLSGANERGDYNGNRKHQAATLMHEFGHNLGLGHGGINNGEEDNTNCKPNYVSIMSYTRQMPTLLPSSQHKLDYSRGDLNPLNESNLDEKKGITTKSELIEVGDVLIYGGPILDRKEFANRPIDWNSDGKFETRVQADINKLPIIKACRGNSPGEVLVGNSDWDNLIYITTPKSEPFTNPTLEQGAEDVTSGISEELTYEDVNAMVTTNLQNLTYMTNTVAPESIATRGSNTPESVEEFYTENIVTDSFTPQPQEDVLSSEDSFELHDFDEGNGAAPSPSFIEEIESGNYHINYTDTINNLETVRDTFDSSLGGLADDDLITDPSDQQRLDYTIDNVIDILKSNSCYEEANCISVEKDANTTITY